MSVVVRVENVSKKYQLGKIGTQSVKGDIQRWWARKRGKEDPFGKIGQEHNGSNGEFWALKDVSFDIHQGEAIGIIGKNGAGKSTLLKILSRITLPTTGRLRVKGRIASLLEVGTGFNPDLTGRENAYLNGAILGMSKREVANKFDEIVDFSGVEKFIDTPVKRYSSGMYVRLAFAVAAHLDSEILILDEVLAVGDTEFQKKCLNKMDEVARKQGRTVIFVSHSAGSIAELCSHAVLLKEGRVLSYDRINRVLDLYLDTLAKEQEPSVYVSGNTAKPIYIKEMRTSSAADHGLVGSSRFSFFEPVVVSIRIHNASVRNDVMIGVAVLNKQGQKVFTTLAPISTLQLHKEELAATVRIPEETLLPGKFYLDAAVFVPNGDVFDYVGAKCPFTVLSDDTQFAKYGDADIGNVNINCGWEIH
jgi:lipopolysaccharide transport system ATP-binding protein